MVTLPPTLRKRNRCENLCRGGGGFLFHFPRPGYQNDVVLTFLERLGNQYDGFYKYVFCRGLIKLILAL